MNQSKQNFSRSRASRHHPLSSELLFRTTIIATLVCAFLVGSVRSASAYYSEVHYSFNYYLARIAGFTPEQARRLSSADDQIDFSEHTEPVQAKYQLSDNAKAQIPRVRFHAFRDVALFKNCQTDVNDARKADEKIPVMRETLWTLSKGEMNFGPFLHFLQDETSHCGYESSKGHWDVGGALLPSGGVALAGTVIGTIVMATAGAPVGLVIIGSGLIGGSGALLTYQSTHLPAGAYTDFLGSYTPGHHMPMIKTTLAYMHDYMKEKCPKQVRTFNWETEVIPVLMALINANPGKNLGNFQPNGPDKAKADAVISQKLKEWGDSTFPAEAYSYKFDANGKVTSGVDNYTLYGKLSLDIKKPANPAYERVRVRISSIPVSRNDRRVVYVDDKIFTSPKIDLPDWLPVGGIVLDVRSGCQSISQVVQIEGLHKLVDIDLTAGSPGSISITSQKVTKDQANPHQYNLTVTYKVDATDIDVTEEAHIECPDSSIVFKDPGSLHIDSPATGERTLVRSHIAERPGNYNFCYSIKSGGCNIPSMPRCVPFTDGDKNIEILSATATSQGGGGPPQLGQPAELKLTYKLNGLDDNETIYPDVPGSVDDPTTSTALTNGVSDSGSNSVSAQKPQNTMTFKFTPTTSGNHVWNYSVEAQNIQTKTGTLAFMVTNPKKIELVDHQVDPVDGKPNNFKLTVRYKLIGMKPGDTQSVSESSIVSGPENHSFPSGPPRTVSDGSVVSKEFLVKVDKAGTYNWQYSIDAGPIGKLENSLSFSVGTKKTIELISASVEPENGFVGDGYELKVVYQLKGLNPGETVDVNENDYVSFAKKTFSNSTTHVKASSDAPLIRKTAAFTATQSGKHIWNFIIDAPGFQTLYGASAFNVADKEVPINLNARLEFPMITIAPGETKNCSIYISGYRGNTADRVFVVYPDITDGWGSLPEQIVVFPGNTSMDPWSMRGAGDYTREYALGQGYTARSTASPGIRRVKIIVRQKDAADVFLTLFVKVVEKNTSTIGTETPPNPPRLPGTYKEKPIQPGSESSPENSGEVETPGGTVKPGGVTIPKDNKNNQDTSNRNSDNTNTSSSNSGSSTSEPSNTGTTISSRPTGASVPTVPINNTEPTSGTNEQSNHTYVFSRAVFEKAHDTRSVTLSTGGASQGTVTTGRVARIPVATTHTNNMSYQAPITEEVVGDVSVTFPQDFVLVSNQARVSASGSANASIERKGESLLEGQTETQEPNVEIALKGGPNEYTTIDSTPFFRTGRRSLSGSWQIPLEFSGQNGARELSANISNGYVIIGDGTIVRLQSVVYVLQGTQDKSKKDDTVNEGDQDTSSKPDDSQLTAWLETPSITLVAGRLPSTSSNIMIKGWKRDVSSPVEVVFPGQTFGNNLPDELIVNPGGGKQDPSALSAISSDEGVYRWTQGFEAKIQAKPGVYQVPILVRQAGVGQIQLVLNVKVEANKNLRSGVINEGNVQALLNKVKPLITPGESHNSPPQEHPQPSNTPGQSHDSPPQGHPQPSNTPGQPHDSPPQEHPQPSNKPTGFAGTWSCDTHGAITFTDTGNGYCRGVYRSGANAKGYWQGVVVNGVFTGVYSFDYFGEKITGKFVARLEENGHSFKANWTSATGRTGFWNVAKME